MPRYGDLADSEVYNMLGGDATRRHFLMSSFTPEELEYLSGRRRLARIATVLIDNVLRPWQPRRRMSRMGAEAS